MKIYITKTSRNLLGPIVTEIESSSPKEALDEFIKQHQLSEDEAAQYAAITKDDYETDERLFYDLGFMYVDLNPEYY